MKRLIRAQEDILAMSKIVNKYAIPSIADKVGKYIYFSECNSSHSPRIKFYGGTSETSATKDAPSLSFDTEGNCTLEIADWMNKKNCPNAFDIDYVDKIESFVKYALPILLLVWFKHLDEADALAYFHGQIDFAELLDCIDTHTPESIQRIRDLDNFCRENNLYKF